MTGARDDGTIPLADDGAPKKRSRRRAARVVLEKDPRPCPGCGYDLRGQPTGGRCPECGAATADPMRQRGPVLLLHAGASVVLRVLFTMLPITILSVLALAILVAGSVTSRFDDRAVFAFPASMALLCVAGLLMCLPQLEPPATVNDGRSIGRRVLLALVSLAWIGHAISLVMVFLALSAAPPSLAPIVDVAYSIVICALSFAGLVFFQRCARRLGELERWVTGDDEGSLLSFGVGLLVLWPLAALGLIAALVSWWGSAPHVRLVWRLDLLVTLLASIDFAFRCVRMMRYLIHTQRLAREHLSREDRLETQRRRQFEK